MKVPGLTLGEGRLFFTAGVSPETGFPALIFHAIEGGGPHRRCTPIGEAKTAPVFAINFTDESALYLFAEQLKLTEIEFNTYGYVTHDRMDLAETMEEK